MRKFENTVFQQCTEMTCVNMLLAESIVWEITLVSTCFCYLCYLPLPCPCNAFLFSAHQLVGKICIIIILFLFQGTGEYDIFQAHLGYLSWWLPGSCITRGHLTTLVFYIFAPPSEWARTEYPGQWEFGWFEHPPSTRAMIYQMHPPPCAALMSFGFGGCRGNCSLENLYMYIKSYCNL